MGGKNTQKAGIWTTFGITDPGGGVVVTKVEVGTQHFLSIITSIIATMSREISWNGGSSWSADYPMSEADTEVLTETERWVDVTGATTWDWTKLNDTNLQVRITCKQGNDATGFTMSLDVIFVRVTYILPGIVTKTITARVKVQGLSLTKDAIGRVKASGITLTKDMVGRILAAGLTVTKNIQATVGAGGPTTYSIDKYADARVSLAGITLTKDIAARIKASFETTKDIGARVVATGILAKDAAARVLGITEIQKTINSRVIGTVSINKAIQACVDFSTERGLADIGSGWRR